MPPCQPSYASSTHKVAQQVSVVKTQLYVIFYNSECSGMGSMRHIVTSTQTSQPCSIQFTDNYRVQGEFRFAKAVQRLFVIVIMKHGYIFKLTEINAS